jgi:hypothetical protein
MMDMKTKKKKARKNTKMLNNLEKRSSDEGLVDTKLNGSTGKVHSLFPR